MSPLDIAIVLIVAGTAVIAYEVGKLRSQIHRGVDILQSVDEELFRLAQEHNPRYGLCSRCGHKAIVRHVIPLDGELSPDASEMFYCQNCWWLSGTVELGSEQKYFKDRTKERDAIAARTGPATKAAEDHD